MAVRTAKLLICVFSVSFCAVSSSEVITGTRAFYAIFQPMLESPDWPIAYEEYRGGLIVMNPFNATRSDVLRVKKDLDATVVMYWDSTDMKIKVPGKRLAILNPKISKPPY